MSPTVLVNAADKSGKMIPAVMHAGKTGYVYVHDRKDCSLIRFSDPMVSSEGPVDVADADAAARPQLGADVPGRERRRRMVAARDRPEPQHGLSRSTCISR